MSDDGCALELVLFGAAGSRFAVPAAQVAAMRPATGEELPTMESALGLTPPAADPGPRRQLLIRAGARLQPLLAGEPIELRTLPCALIHPAPPLLAARTQVRGLKALARVDDGIVPVIDFAAPAAPEAPELHGG